MNRDSKILLLGGNFKNKGAEAMVLTLSKILQHQVPNCSIVLASYANEIIEKDKEGNAIVDSKNTHVKIIKNKKKVLQPLRLVVYWLTKKRKIAGNDEFCRHLLQADAVIDVSGFAFSDDRGLLRQMMYCLEIVYCKFARKPFLANSQAFGPFKSFCSKILAKLFLHKVDILNVRGETSLHNIKRVNPKATKKSLLCMDSAFLFENADEERVKKVLTEFKIDHTQNTVAIIPNINIYNRMGELYIKIMSEFCSQVLDSHDVTLVFICHEFYDDKKDDKDLIQEIISGCSKEQKSRMIVIDKKYSAAMLKGIVAKMEMVIASRYHAIVASISVCTPVLVIGWAHKYKDLLNDAKLENCLIEYQNLTTKTLYTLFKENWSKHTQLKEILQNEHDQIVLSSKKGVERIVSFVKKIQE